MQVIHRLGVGQDQRTFEQDLLSRLRQIVVLAFMRWVVTNLKVIKVATQSRLICQWIDINAEGHVAQGSRHHELRTAV